MSSRRILVVVLVVLLAGCTTGPTSGPPATPGTDGEPETRPPAEPRPPSTATSAPTEPARTETVAGTATPVPPDNPWREEPVVIGIRGQGESPVNYSESVARAADYWQENDHADLAYAPPFVVDPDATSPHLLVRLADRIEQCGAVSGNETVGCAPVLTSTEPVDSPVTVRIQRGLTNESTYRVVRHELGHVLGLEHGEGPDRVMSPTGIVHDRVVTVALEFETTAVHEQRDTRRQVRYASNYYADGAEGFLTEEVGFAIIEDRSHADVVVDVRESGGGSTAAITDGRLVITLEGIETDNRGWHVGYWLGYYFGAQSVDDLPPPFDEPSADPRRQWWH